MTKRDDAAADKLRSAATLSAANLLEASETQLDAQSYFDLSLLLYRSRNFELAEKASREALKRDHGLSRAHVCLGILLYKKEEFSAAEKCFRSALDIDHRTPGAYTNLGFLQLKRDDPKGAEACFREALVIDKDDAPARRGLERALDILSEKDCPSDFRCPLSLERFRNPAMLVQSGLTYEHAHLRRALQERPGTDPQTNLRFHGEAKIAPNHTLKRAVVAWYDAWVAQRATASSAITTVDADDYGVAALC